MKYLLSLFLISLSFSTAGAEEKEIFESYFPKEAKAGYILEYDKLPEKFQTQTPRFRLDDKGRLTLLIDQTLFFIEDKKLLPYPLPMEPLLSDYGWMKEGTLLGIKGSQLGVPTQSGHNLLMDLPDTFMRISPAGEDSIYLFDGKNSSQRNIAYLVKKGQGLKRIAQTTKAITAITGDGENTFYALGHSIYFQAPNKPARLIYSLPYPVKSLAYAPPFGLFFATHAAVGFVLKPGIGFTFLKTFNAQVMVHKRTLFLALPGKGVLKVSPIDSFETMATKMAVDVENWK